MKNFFNALGILLSLMFLGAEPFGYYNIIGLFVFLGISISVINKQQNERRRKSKSTTTTSRT